MKTRLSLLVGHPLCVALGVLVGAATLACADDASSGADASTGAATGTTASPSTTDNATEADSSGTGEAHTDSTGSTGTADSSTGLNDSTTGDDACGRCGPSQSHCVDGECAPCSTAPDPNASCAAVAADLPVCHEGECVACTLDSAEACPEGAPICSLPDFVCVECTDHTDCPGSACDIAEGTCLAPEQVVHVDTSTCDPDGVCALGAAPCCSVNEALALPADALVIIVHGDTNVVGSAALNDRTLALIGASGGGFAAHRLYADPAAQIEIDGGRLYIADLFVAGATGPWLAVSDGLVRLDRATVEHTGAPSIALDGAGAEARVVSSVMYTAVGSTPSFIDASGGATVDVRYSTLALTDDTTAITCSAGNVATIRSSLVVSANDVPATLCPGADVTYSATSFEVDGTGNQAIGPLSASWFQALQFDYHLTDQHPALISSVARWTGGDPLVDLDQEERMVGEGAMGYAGADRP